MNDRIIAKDQGCGLMLVRNEQDPPRYYLRLNGRRELISIGDTAEAMSHFSREARRLRSLRQRHRPAAAANVIQFPQRLPDIPGAVTPAPEVSHAA
jgi:hypothetical protein